MENCATNALSRVVDVLHALDIKIVDFERIKDEYSVSGYW